MSDQTAINARVDKFKEAARNERLDIQKVVTQPPAARPGGPTHKAYCKNDAGAATTIVCYLDTDETGQEITVNCSIAGGGNLNTAIPRLTDGLLIFVKNFGGAWYCTGTIFTNIGAAGTIRWVTNQLRGYFKT